MVDKIGWIALANDVWATINAGSNTINVLSTNAISFFGTTVTANANTIVLNSQDNDLNGFQLVGQRANVSNLNGIAYTIDSANTGEVLYFSNTLFNVVVTCAATANVGTAVTCIQGNTKNVKFIVGVGAGVFNRQGHQNTAGRYASVSLIVTVNANTTGANWVLMGDTFT